MLRKLAKKYVVPRAENDFRPYLLRSVGVLLVLVVAVGAFFASNVYRIALETSDFIASVLPSVLVDLANADRSAFSLGSLAINPTLEEAARLKVEDMVAKSYFAHNSPEGVKPWHWFGVAGYHFAYAGENLAINFDDSAAVNAAWMNSESHRANILNNHFTEIGIATARGVYEGRETTFVVQMFGNPAEVPVEPSVSATATPTAALAETLVPLGQSSVLGTAAKETFVAVRNTSATPAHESPPLVKGAVSVVYASAFDRLVSSPTRLLALVYILMGVLLCIVLLSVLFTRHDRRGRHTLIILLLLLIIAGLYFGYRAFVLSRVNVLEPTSPQQQ